MSTSASISYQYADGSANTIRRTGVTYPNGRQVSYLYNGLDDRLSRVTALANSPLGQGMRSYWRLDENVTSGARFDSIGTNGLTDVNSNVGSASGLFGGKAAQFVAANLTYLNATALNGLIYDGSTSFTTAGWIKFNSVSGVIGLWGKGNSGNASYTQQEWMLYIEGNYIYWVLSDGTHSTVLNSNTYVATGQWYFVVAGYDAVSGRAFVQIDNGTEYSTTSLGPTDRGNGFTIGRTYDHFLSGLVQSVGVWDRVLSSSERTALYNGGSGFDLQVHAKYTYLGLNTVVKVDYPQPAVGLDLATGSGANPYQGLDRFGRVVDNLWKQYATATTADQIKYGYDRNSNRTHRENPVAKGLPTPKYFDELYANDGLNRLQAMQRGQLTGTPPNGITNQNFGQAWMLDPTGNWGQFQEDATGGGIPTLSQTRISNEVNEITSITNASPAPAWAQPHYDPAGNMTTVPQPADMTKKYTATFDAWNRLTKLVDPDTGHTVQENQYDGLIRRTVQKSYDSSGALAETRRYYYSSAWQVLEERLGTSTTPDRQFVWGLRYIDDLILRDRSVTGVLDERLFALQDANWNVVALVNTSGAVQQRFAYSPYGVPMLLNADFTAGSNSKDWETLFCGYRWDQNNYSSVALYLVRYRWLHVQIGNWLTTDPSKSIRESYYVNCRPSASRDPSGLAALTDVKNMKVADVKANDNTVIGTNDILDKNNKRCGTVKLSLERPWAGKKQYDTLAIYFAYEQDKESGACCCTCEQGYRSEMGWIQHVFGSLVDDKNWFYDNAGNIVSKPSQNVQPVERRKNWDNPWYAGSGEPKGSVVLSLPQDVFNAKEFEKSPLPQRSIIDKPSRSDRFITQLVCAGTKEGTGANAGKVQLQCEWEYDENLSGDNGFFIIKGCK